MGRYEGELVTVWKPDGRLMELQKPFAFVDKDEEAWPVPAGAHIDGASIPQFLWAITGSPYTGKYRDASVIHDWYCSVRTRTSAATHAMFHEAMLVSNVSRVRAGIMYAAVRYAGPKWTDMDIKNNNLASEDRFGQQNYWGPGGLPPFDTPEYYDHIKERVEERLPQQPRIEVHVRADANEEEFRRIAEKIEAEDLDPDAIDKVISALPKAKTRALKEGLYRFNDGVHPDN